MATSFSQVFNRIAYRDKKVVIDNCAAFFVATLHCALA
jgi:hypothetical protein